jgi:hypothetical protein
MLSGFSCRTKKIKSTQLKPEEKTAFYDLKFKYDSILKKSIITLNSIKIIDQKINYVPDEQASKKLSFVYIEITDKDKNTIKAYAEHPLYRKFDVYEETGKIESKLVSLPEADMTIRVPYYSPYEKIKITEAINRTQTLTTILKNEK